METDRYERYKTQKLCPNCGQPNRSSFTYCDDCRDKKREKYRATKPVYSCAGCGSPVARKGGWCDKCRPDHEKEKWREWYAKNAERIKPKERERYRDNRAAIRARANVRARTLRYGLTQADVIQLLEAQEGKCAICKKPFKTNKDGTLKFHIDHDHDALGVRGLLCGSCNMGIGLLKDSVDILGSAIKYLTRK